MENVALGKSADHRRRNNVENEVQRGLGLLCRRVHGYGIHIQGRRIHVHPGARLKNIDKEKSDKKCERRDDFKVEKSNAADLADFLHVFHSGNTDDHRTENHRGNEHFDELNEAVPERLHRRADVGKEKT